MRRANRTSKSSSAGASRSNGSLGVLRRGVSRPVRAGAVAGVVAGLIMACENPQAPVSCGPIPQQTVHVGESASITACFNDANGDVLSYAVSSSNGSVVGATHGGAEVMVAARAPGSATIIVTAADSDGLQGQQRFGVVVPNRPPRAAGSIGTRRVNVGESVVIDLAPRFEEPDGQSLTFDVTPADRAVAGVALSGSRVTLVGLTKGLTNVTVTATDPGGLAAVQVFGFEVPNRQPVALGTIEGQVLERGKPRTLDLGPWFDDPDGDPLAYKAASSSPGAVTAAVSGATLQLTVVGAGRSAVTVTARDPDGLVATHGFSAESVNRPPRPVGSIPALTMQVGEAATNDASPYFTDPDEDPLGLHGLLVGRLRGHCFRFGLHGDDYRGCQGLRDDHCAGHRSRRPRRDAGVRSHGRQPGAGVAGPDPGSSCPRRRDRRGRRVAVLRRPRRGSADVHGLLLGRCNRLGPGRRRNAGGLGTEERTGDDHRHGNRSWRTDGHLAFCPDRGRAARQPGFLPSRRALCHPDEHRAGSGVSECCSALDGSARGHGTADMPVPQGFVRCRFPERAYEERVSVVDDLLVIAAVAESMAPAGPSRGPASVPSTTVRSCPGSA